MKKIGYNPKYDYSNLRGEIKKVFGVEYKFAEALGRSHNYITNVWKGISYFEQRDIAKIIELLNIPDEEIKLNFFSLKSSQNENN